MDPGVQYCQALVSPCLGCFLLCWLPSPVDCFETEAKMSPGCSGFLCSLVLTVLEMSTFPFPGSISVSQPDLSCLNRIDPGYRASIPGPGTVPEGEGALTGWCGGCADLTIEEAGPQGNSMKPARDIPLAQQLEASRSSRLISPFSTFL